VVYSVKPAKTREELSSVIFARLSQFPEGDKVTGVVIAPTLRPYHTTWHAAFVVRPRSAVPPVAWRIGEEVAAQFDLV